MDLLTMVQLLEAEALQGTPISQNRLAFLDMRVPDRMLYSPVVSRQLARPLAWHLSSADAGSYPVWTLADIMQLTTADDLAEAEAFARAHYGPAPPPSLSDATRPVRRQRRGCRGGKGRKRHATTDESLNQSPRIMSGGSSSPVQVAAAPSSWPGASGVSSFQAVPQTSYPAFLR